MANQKMGVKVKKLAGIILGTAIALSGCGGSGTNNDQGTSFLAYGYFASATTSTTGVTGVAVSLLEGSGTLADSTNPQGFGTVVFMGLQNRLSAQFMRVTQITCGYEVPGSSVALYQNSYNASGVISPAGTAGTSVVGAGTVSSVNFGFTLFTHDVLAYFSNRINELPQLPFIMNVECYATGISQSGSVFQTNPLGIQVTMVDDLVTAEPVVDTGGAVLGATINPTSVDDTTGNTTDTGSITAGDTSAL